MAKVVIFGVGQFSDVASFYIENDSEHEIVGYTIDKDFRKNDKHKNLPLVNFEDLEKHFSQDEVKLFIPISYKSVNKIREARYLNAKKRGYSFITYISSRSAYYGTPVGENCFIMENNTIQPFVEIGDNVTIWSGNHLGHHSKIANSCFITSHVVISGAVNIGERSFLGVNSTIRDNVNIGKDCVIGAGSTVLKDIPDNSVLSAKSTKISNVPSNRLRGI